MHSSNDPLAMALAGLMMAVFLAAISFARKLMYKALGDRGGRMVEFLILLGLFGVMIYATLQAGKD